MKTLIISLFSVFFLVACGQKGALFLSEKPIANHKHIEKKSLNKSDYKKPQDVFKKPNGKIPVSEDY